MDIMPRGLRHVQNSERDGSDADHRPGGCSRSIGHEGRDLTLTLSCRDCGGKDPDGGAGPPYPLSNPKCLRNILEALSAEQGVDTLILAGHIETQIQSAGMAVMEKIVVLGNDLNHLSLRDPPKGSRDCARCGLHPQELFQDLRSVLLSDLADFPKALKGGISRVIAAASSSDEACARCVGDTSGDLAFAAETFEGLARSLMKQGFQIVV
jgi:hypothetical protein